MELVDFLDMDTIGVVVMGRKDGVDIFLQGRNLLNGLHGIAPVTGRHSQGSRNARDLG